MAGTDEATQGQVGAVAELKLRVPAELSDWLARYAEKAGQRNTRGEPNRTWAAIDIFTRMREIEATGGGQIGREAITEAITVALRPIEVDVATTLRLATETLACAMGQGHFTGRDADGARARMNGFRAKVREKHGLGPEEL